LILSKEAIIAFGKADAGVIIMEESPLRDWLGVLECYFLGLLSLLSLLFGSDYN